MLISRYSLLIAALLLALAAGPADAMRCSNRVISDGDTTGEVRRWCGEPQQIDTRDQPVSIEVVDPRSGITATQLVTRSISVWTYNRGPRRLIQELWFENGRLTRSLSLGFGY